MEHDHQSSKGEGKAAATRSRKNVTAYLSSEARGVFDLQRAAGNKAVAKMLTSSAGGPKVQRIPRSPTPAGSVAPVTVQRDLLEDASSKDAVEASDLDFKDFAQKLVKLTKKGSLEGATTTGSAESGTAGSGKAATEKSLKKRRDALANAKTKEGRDLKRQDRALKGREERQKNEDKLLDLANKAGPKLTRQKLGKVPTEAQVARMEPPDLQGAIDDLEEEIKTQEERRKYMRKLQTPKMTKGQAFNMWKGI